LGWGKLTTVYVGTLQRAVDILGGEEQLALQLMVTPSHLALWIRGEALPPEAVFFKAVDIVTEYDLEQLRTKHEDGAANDALVAGFLLPQQPKHT
jgi:hypothetical protein